MSNNVTIGVAVAMPEPHASVLRGWRRRVGDPEADRIPPHVTVLPPTQFAEQDLDVIEKHLEQAAATVPPFVMRLAGTGTFRPVSEVVFVQVSAGIAECELLQWSVRRGPITRELLFPYHPHVTVGHDLPSEALDEAFNGLQDFVAQFAVERLTMYHQDAAGAWCIGREFPLTGK